MVTKLPISFTLKTIGTTSLVAGLFFFSFTFQTSFNMKDNVRTLIYHKVENYDKWKMTFDGAKGFRMAAGELNYETGTLLNDPGVAYVINEWPTQEAFQTFVSNPELANTMKQAGVLESPHLIVFIENEKSRPVGGKIKTLIFHPIENFEKWKSTFSAAKDFRAAQGELSYEIGTFQSDPNTVYILNEWNSVADFQAFLARPELSEAMKNAGVLSPPTVLIFDKKAGS